MLRPALIRIFEARGLSHAVAAGRRQRSASRSRSLAGKRRTIAGISTSQFSGNGPTAPVEVSTLWIDQTSSLPLSAPGFSEPIQRTSPRLIELDLGARFGEQHRGLARALSAPDHGHAPVAQMLEAVVRARMAHQIGGEAGEFRRLILLVRQAQRDDDAARGHSLAVFELECESAGSVVDQLDAARIEIGRDLR